MQLPVPRLRRLTIVIGLVLAVRSVPGCAVRALRRLGRRRGQRPRPPPRPAPLGVETTLTFSGCGGLYVYFFGVASYIQERGFDLSRTAFASASAGAFPAFLLAADMNVADFHARENHDLLDDVARRPLGPLNGWNDAVHDHFTRAITARRGERAFELANGRHFISLTEARRGVVCGVRTRSQARRVWRSHAFAGSDPPPEDREQLERQEAAPSPRGGGRRRRLLRYSLRTAGVERGVSGGTHARAYLKRARASRARAAAWRATDSTRSHQWRTS